GSITPISVTTDGTGAYQFTGLRPGTYTITQAATPLYGEGTNSPGTPANGLVSGDAIGSISLAVGASLAGYNFGEVSGSLAGRVTVDAAAGLSGVTLTLFGTDITSHAIASRTTTTSATGTYSFSGLVAGTYTLSEAATPLYGQGTN